MEQSCVCSQCQEHLSSLCFSRCCFLVRNQSGTRSLSALWERDLFPLKKTLPCHHSSLEVLSSACDTHLRRLTFTSTRRQVQQQPVPASVMLRLQICPGHTGPMICTTAQNKATTRKQAQLLLLGLLPFVLGFHFPSHCADGFCPVPVAVFALLWPAESGVRHC